MSTQEIFKLVSTILSSIIFASLLAFPIINSLYKLNIVRKIDVDFSTLIENRKKKYGTPIMGGLIIVVPTLLVNLVFNLHEVVLVPLIILATAAFLGGLDDLLNIFGKKRKRTSLRRALKLIKVHKHLSERAKNLLLIPWYTYRQFINAFESNPGTGLGGHEKFLVQILMGTLLGYWIYSDFTSALWFPFLGEINIGLLIIPFAIFTLLSMTNAVNFSDGMDGLSSGMLISAFAGFFFIAVLEGNSEIAFLIATVIGSLITYLYFNIPPARVQMGDVGSFSMGALLAVVAFALGYPMLLPVIGFPFVVEIFSSVAQSAARRIFGKRILKMAPLHHHFEMSGWSEEKVVMRAWLFSILSSIVGIWIYFL